MRRSRAAGRLRRRGDAALDPCRRLRSLTAARSDPFPDCARRSHLATEHRPQHRGHRLQTTDLPHRHVRDLGRNRGRRNGGKILLGDSRLGQRPDRSAACRKAFRSRLLPRSIAACARKVRGGAQSAALRLFSTIRKRSCANGSTPRPQLLGRKARKRAGEASTCRNYGFGAWPRN